MMINRFGLASFAAAATLLAAPFASAQLATISEDFEGLDAASGTALGDVGFVVFANVFDTDGTTFLYNYGTDPAPNGTGAFSNVTTGEGGPSQGAQGLVTFSDYNNTDHNLGRVIETLVFQEQTITAGDEGVWVFSFDAKDGDIGGSSTAEAFIKTLDPGAGFFVSNNLTVDTTTLPSTWGRFNIAINVTSDLVGQILQVGFETRAANFEDSGVNYDNLSFDRFSGGIVPVVDEDFEALDAASGTALGDVGFVVFANVFDTDGTTFLYNYGTDPAPNGTGAFSNVTTGEGGPDQGDQGLVTFSDYNNTDHNLGRVIETLVFQEFTITAADVGAWVLEFDAKAADLVSPSTATAFVKTLDPNAGFFTTSNAELDMSGLPTTWDTFQIAVQIDASQVGQILQAGFETTAANFDASGVNYDNYLFGPLGAADTDGDGVTDDVDNCTLVANADQRDTNGDGFGNICDADFNGDCIINPLDLGIFRAAFFQPGDLDEDLNGDGIVNPLDLGIFRSQFFGPPGPNSTGTCP